MGLFTLFLACEWHAFFPELSAWPYLRPDPEGDHPRTLRRLVALACALPALPYGFASIAGVLSRLLGRVKGKATLWLAAGPACDLRRQRAKVGLLVAGVLGCGGFGLLRYGNPQWSRVIFIFQSCVYPRDLRIMNVPAGYTGTWRAWHIDGRKMEEIHFLNGVAHGRGAQWYPTGRLSREGWFDHGRREGKWVDWRWDGRVMMERNYKRGELHGKWIEWDREGEIELVEWYDHGKVIRRELDKRPANEARQE